ncbi:MAG TPA: ankyrin repeat domain-containing protein [Vicinamibacterales bacterium]|nr:ankyrin repeat domain-containing protein [Vicinamibacterales bacterium]
MKVFIPRTCAVILVITAGALHAADDPALVRAVRTGDSKAVAALIQQKADVNAVAIDGTTALHWAVRADDLETVDALIRAGAQVKTASRHGVTPLYLAADLGNAAMIRRLVAAGGDANTTDISGDTVLMAAVRAGSIDAVRALLDAGAQVNTAEPQVGHTALMWAVREDRPELVSLLLTRGATVDVKTRTGSQPAARPPGAGGGSHGVGIVRGGVPPQGEQPPAPGGMTALSFAAREGRLGAARLLLDAGADVNAGEANGISPLVMAITNRHTPVAALLLARGADPNARDWWGRTPLWSAVDMRNLDLDSRTLENGVERAPVLELIEALIAKGADINARVKEFPPQRRFMMPLGSLAWVDFTGQTPFVRAALSADVPLMKLLLSKGADPNLATFNGTTALMAAAGVNWVIGQTYSESPAMYLEAVKLCLELGGDVNAVNAMGLAAVHGAANRGSDDIIELLAKNGARLDIKDKEGRTPLAWAEGVFLATNSPVAKPSTMALIRKLVAASSSASGGR